MPKINLVPAALFHTPEDWKELHDWIDRHAPSERAHLTVAAVMAWNLAAKLVAEAQAEVEAE